MWTRQFEVAIGEVTRRAPDTTPTDAGAASDAAHPALRWHRALHSRSAFNGIDLEVQIVCTGGNRICRLVVNPTWPMLFIKLKRDQARQMQAHVDEGLYEGLARRGAACLLYTSPSPRD